MTFTAIEREEYKHYTTDAESHYFASSAAGWGADASLAKAIQKSKDGLKGPKEILVYFVPVGVKASCKIQNYAPQVEGAVFIGRVTA